MKRIILVALLVSGSTTSAMDEGRHLVAEAIGFAVAYLIDRAFIHPHRYNAPEVLPRANARPAAAPAHAAPAPAAQPVRNGAARFGGHVQSQSGNNCANRENRPIYDNAAHVQSNRPKKVLLTIGTIGLVTIVMCLIAKQKLSTRQKLRTQATP